MYKVGQNCKFYVLKSLSVSFFFLIAQSVKFSLFLIAQSVKFSLQFRPKWEIEKSGPSGAFIYPFFSFLLKQPNRGKGRSSLLFSHFLSTFPLFKHIVNI